MKAMPLAMARYFSGSTSDGIACTMAIVAKVVPMRIPPPIKVAILCALAQTTAPANAISGGTAAMYFRSNTSLSLPTKGDRTDCISNGPWMTQPLMAGDPRSCTMKAMTDPAATTTKTCAMMAKQETKTTIQERQVRWMCWAAWSSSMCCVGASFSTSMPASPLVISA